MGIAFLLCGLAAGLIFRNAITIAILTALSAPVAAVAAVISTNGAFSAAAFLTWLWLYGAFVAGAAAGMGAVGIYCLLSGSELRLLRSSRPETKAERKLRR
jgi:hypothetical protein